MPPGRSCPQHVSSTGAGTSLVDRGRLLFASTGCTACHNESGRGGIRNPNYIKQSVPALDSLAERMYLFDREEMETVVALLEQDADLAALEEDPPFRRYNRFLAQYNSVHSVIQEGKPAGCRDSTLAAPPLHMPAWGAVLERRDVDAIIGYLLTEYPWEDD